MENKTRAFICITFPDEIIKEVARIQEIISKQKFTGKLTELENLHLTLKFLGETDDETINKIREKLKSIKFESFKAKLEKSGTFNIKSKPKIVWLKIASKEIYALQKQIDETLKPFFPPEERFMSHLTIARIKYVKDKKSFTEYIKKIKPKQLEFEIKSFELKSSELQPLGPLYTTLGEYPPKGYKALDNLSTNLTPHSNSSPETKTQSPPDSKVL